MKAFDILSKRGFEKKGGGWYELNSSIDYDEAKFLESLIKKYEPGKTLEIGCATGISSLIICEAIGSNGSHTIIDAFQSTDWENHGLNNLSNAGFSNFRLIEELSEFVLPNLLKSGEKYDFVFVDGWHTFDHVLVEFFYINRLLHTGGIVVFDDTSLEGLNRLMRYISNYPNYECIGHSGEIRLSKSRQIINLAKKLFYFLSLPMGKRMGSEIFNDTVIRSNSSLGINGSVVAFRKTAEDKRGWAWYKPF